MSTPRKPLFRPHYVGEQVARWFLERQRLPIIVADLDDRSITAPRIHCADNLRPGLPLCWTSGRAGGTATMRPATIDDMSRYRACRSCTSVNVLLIGRRSRKPEPCS